MKKYIMINNLFFKHIILQKGNQYNKLLSKRGSFSLIKYDNKNQNNELKRMNDS